MYFQVHVHALPRLIDRPSNADPYKGGKFICWHFLLLQPSVVSDKINYSLYFGPVCKTTLKKIIFLNGDMTVENYVAWYMDCHLSNIH